MSLQTSISIASVEGAFIGSAGEEIFKFKNLILLHL
jgi:hypothetical protein